VHEAAERLKDWISAAEDEAVVALVDGRGDECCGFRVCPGDGKEVDACWGDLDE